MVNIFYVATLRPLIDIALSHSYKSVIFKQCSFMKNHNNYYLISILLSSDKVCYGRIKDCIGVLTNITFVRCQFTNNFTELMNTVARQCTANLFIVGPSCVVYTSIRSQRCNISFWSNYPLNYSSDYIIKSWCKHVVF